MVLLCGAFLLQQGRVSVSKLQMDLLLYQARRARSQLSLLALPRSEILEVIHHKPPDSKRSDDYIKIRARLGFHDAGDLGLRP